ncbi:MAG: T9SS type A sorting domain-containing protein [Bacteroidota bacterium]
MTRPLLSLLFGCTLLVPTAVGQSLDAGSLSLTDIPTLPARGGGDLLYEQYEGGTTSGWFLSENFEAANDDADSYLADDFTVPDGASWTVDQVRAQTFYSVADNGTFTPAASFNVILWEDDSVTDPNESQPGREVARFDEVAATQDTGADRTLGEVILDLPSSVELSAGTYWLTIQANQDFTANGTRFLIFSSATAFGTTAQLFNYGGGFTTVGTCNLDWGAVNGAECARDGTGDPSLYFQIYGVSTGGTAVEPTVAGGFELSAPAPHPVRTEARMSVSVETTQQVTATLIDVAGREVRVLHEGLVQVGTPLRLSVQTHGLASGLYLLRLSGETGVATRPVVIAR